MIRRNSQESGAEQTRGEDAHTSFVKAGASSTINDLSNDAEWSACVAQQDNNVLNDSRAKESSKDTNTACRRSSDVFAAIRHIIPTCKSVRRYCRIQAGVIRWFRPVSDIGRIAGIEV